MRMRIGENPSVGIWGLEIATQRRKSCGDCWGCSSCYLTVAIFGMPTLLFSKNKSSNMSWRVRLDITGSGNLYCMQIPKIDTSGMTFCFASYVPS